jgi:hypothetical protein
MSAVAITAPAERTTWDLSFAPEISADALAVNVEGLCTTMLWMRSWWAAYKDTVRAADPRAASEINDRFTDGAIFAHAAADSLGIQLDDRRMKNYRWGNSVQTLRTITPAQKPAAWQGGAA